MGNKYDIIVSTWTYVARRRSDRKVKDKAFDIRLATLLEEPFENVLATSSREYFPLLRPE